MSDNHQVNIADLLKISEGLSNNYFVSHNLYFLLVLALMTVTTYSNNHFHLSTETRLDLSIALLPDLITHLTSTDQITSEEAEYLITQQQARKDELYSILKAYIYVSAGLRTKPKNDDSPKWTKLFKHKQA